MCCGDTVLLVCRLCRRLYDRIVTLKFRPKTMKSFFKQYLQFEQSFGTVDTAEAVKDKARQYVAAVQGNDRE